MPELRMGLLDLFALPVSLPLKTAWIAIEEATALAQQEYEEARRLPGELADLQAAYEMGEITEMEYLRALDEGGREGDAGARQSEAR